MHTWDFECTEDGNQSYIGCRCPKIRTRASATSLTGHCHLRYLGKIRIHMLDLTRGVSFIEPSAMWLQLQLQRDFLENHG